MATYISQSPEATRALGEKWGRTAQAGLVLGLTGDLGAGKTQLVKGIAAGLGCPARVHSPTYSLLNRYDGGRVALVHLDLYRLHGRAEIASAGLEEYLVEPEGITVVEWVERWTAGSSIPGLIRQVVFEHLSEFERKIIYDDSLA
jgi:tRNA threonylcarbamoyladenosine biosynthesis protein TsaE